jgi:hypothetical protein
VFYDASEPDLLVGGATIAAAQGRGECRQP